MIRAETVFVLAALCFALGAAAGVWVGKDDGYQEGYQAAVSARQPARPAPCKFKYMSRRYCELNCWRKSDL